MPQDGRRRRNHRAMTDTQIALLFFFLFHFLSHQPHLSISLPFSFFIPFFLWSLRGRMKPARKCESHIGGQSFFCLAYVGPILFSQSAFMYHSGKIWVIFVWPWWFCGVTNYLSIWWGQITNLKVMYIRGRGGGQVVSVLTFYSDEPSSNTTEVSNFCCNIVVE